MTEVYLIPSEKVLKHLFIHLSSWSRNLESEANKFKNFKLKIENPSKQKLKRNNTFAIIRV